MAEQEVSDGDEMMSPKEKIAAWMREEREAEIDVLLNMTIGQTPIENILFCAFVAMTIGAGGPYRTYRFNYRKIETIEQAIDSINNNEQTIKLLWSTQYQIELYKADFVFICPLENGCKKLVVECDGHEFHERTKAQAVHDRARDRRMQELGFLVYRFTGSEIYRDPMKCARQIINWAATP